MPNANRYYSTLAIRKLHDLVLGGETTGISLTNLDDVIITTPSSGHVLRYNGTNFVNTQLAHSDLSGIGSLSHATIDSYLDQAVKTTSSPTLRKLTINTGTVQEGLTITGAGADTFFDLINTGVGGVQWRISSDSGTGKFSIGVNYGGWNSVLQITKERSLGVTLAPTARLHLPAGTATANTAPFKLTAGTNLTTPEIGAMEFVDDGTTGTLYITVNVAGVVTRKAIAYQ